MAELKFEITESIGQFGETSRGWTRELNLVSWDGREPKYDIRDWNADHTRMGKGITMTAEELASLKDLLNSMEQDSFDSDEFDV